MHDLIAGVRKTSAGHFQPFVMEHSRIILVLQAVRTQREAAAMAERLLRDEETRRRLRNGR